MSRRSMDQPLPKTDLYTKSYDLSLRVGGGIKRPVRPLHREHEGSPLASEH